MCCLRYEHDFYVQSRKRFPKEGKILVTARGEEKVVANDIFNERVTLRAPDGETRVVPLIDLRREMASGLPEPTFEDESTGVTAEYPIDEELIRMQDTAERPAFRAGAGQPRIGGGDVVHLERRVPAAPPGRDRRRSPGGDAAAPGARADRPIPTAPPVSPAGTGAASAASAPAPAGPADDASPAITPLARDVDVAAGDGADDGDSPTDQAAARTGRRRRGRRGGRRGRGRRPTDPTQEAGESGHDPDSGESTETSE
jgi:hypothetical protein